MKQKKNMVFFENAKKKNDMHSMKGLLQICK